MIGTGANHESGRSGMRVAYREELARLEATLLEEGELVRHALERALDALLRQDHAAAERVIACDDAIDERYLTVERGVESLLARQSPVAIDLRLVLAISHINRHLERMADQCVTIAKLTRLTCALPADEHLVVVLSEMGKRALEMTVASVRCVSERDSTSAPDLDASDELIDALNRMVMRKVVDLEGDSERREWGIHMVLVARALERIGDNAVDIAEQAAYLVSGHFQQFTDASHRV
jgi:phosphate transport system protein